MKPDYRKAVNGGALGRELREQAMSYTSNDEAYFKLAALFDDEDGEDAPCEGRQDSSLRSE